MKLIGRMILASVMLASGPFAVDATGAEAVFGEAGCALRDGETGVVAAVTSPVTLQLESGLSVRLAGLMPAGETSEVIRWLEDELVGKTVILRYGTVERDRYGQAFAQLFVAEQGPDPGAWIQADLVAAGHAMVTGFPEERTCLGALMAFERDARVQRLGIWSARMPPSAWSPLLRDVGPRYELVEGRVVSLGRTERTVYLNFGNDWSIDLTVTIDAADLGAFEGGGTTLDGLVGYKIRVRGWLEQWNGPWIRIDHPEQIEVLDQDDGEGSSG